MVRDTTQTPADLLLAEAGIYERDHGDHHPNSARYLGISTGSDGRIGGLCLQRYNETLQERTEDQKRPLNVKRCLEDIRAGVAHVHRRGLVHNDIKPANVMFGNGDIASLGTPVVGSLSKPSLPTATT